MGCANTKVPSEYPDVILSQERNIQMTLPQEEPIEPIVSIEETQDILNHLLVKREEYQILTYEKYGVQRTLDVYQEKLCQIISDQNNSKIKYQGLLLRVVERDVDNVYRALTSQQVEKRVLIDILTARPKWHIAMIADSYEKQYNVQLFRQIRENLTTQFGKITGAATKTDLGRLLQLITTDQPERDGKLLRNNQTDPDGLMEVRFFSFLSIHDCRSFFPGRTINFVLPSMTMRRRQVNHFSKLSADHFLLHFFPSYPFLWSAEEMKLGFLSQPM
jgi:hypothetical protein